MPYCPNCGTEHSPEDSFCSNCGAQLDVGTGTGGEGPLPENEPGGDHDNDRHPQSEGPLEQPQDTPQPPQQSPSGTNGNRKMLSRRQAIIAGGGFSVIIGWFAYDTFAKPPHQVHDGWDVEITETATGEQLTGTVTLPSGRYASRELTPDRPINLDISYSVSEVSNPIDVIVLPDDEYDRYRDRDDGFQVFTDLAEQDTLEGEMSGQLEGGDYKIVLDNTGFIGATPDREVTVDIEIVAEVVIN